MRYIYNGVEPCRIGTNLVERGAEYEFADNPGPLWVPVRPEPPKYKPIPAIKADKE